MARTIVVALGGNAILKQGQSGTAGEQQANTRRAAAGISDLIEQGNTVVVTHGNGPQVGNILIQGEMARQSVPSMPLDICGAKSQGSIGYMLQQALSNELSRRGLCRSVVTVVTQVMVDPGDPAFTKPTKPIGPFYDRREARELSRARGHVMVEDAGRGWRRVVPSPEPLAIVEAGAIKSLVNEGAVVIAAGGGGIPVVRDHDGLRGVEAVIDKDLAGDLLAREVNADLYVILTDVEAVAVNWGTADQRWLDRITCIEALDLLKEGQFAAGSMEPKMRAAVRYASTGKAAVIGCLSRVDDAVHGRAGTWIEPAHYSVREKGE